MVAETSLEPRQLILPMFVAEGLREPRPISSMPGVVQHTLDTLRKAAVEAADAGLAGVMLFGIPVHKDARGSGALDPEGILSAAIRAVREEVGDECLVMSDVCLDEYTDHAHCGRSTGGGAQRHDGWPGRRNPGGPRHSRSLGCGDPGLFGEVRFSVLRSFPRGRRILAQRQPPDLSAGSR